MVPTVEHFCLLVVALISRICCAENPAPFNQKLLVISFDGFRQMYFDNNRFLPWFSIFRRDGVYSDQVQSIFPSETFPNHYAIATGMYAESHGIVANSFYDPNLKQDFQKFYVESYWWDQAEPIWITARKQGKRTAVSFWPGSAVTFPGNWTPNYFDLFDKSITFEKRINDTIYHLVNDNVDLAMVYLFQPDDDGHNYGAPSDQVDAQLKYVDWYLSYILERLDEVNLGKDRFNVIICADHGMVNVTTRVILSDFIDVDQTIERTPSYGSIMTVQPKPGQMDTIMAALGKEASRSGQFVAYRKSDVPAHYHYSNNDRIMDIVIECKLGISMTPKEPTWLNAGAHGYDPSYAEMKPIFLARGPAFKNGGYRAQKSFLTKDIYAIMAHVIGMKPLETNATLENAMDIFNTEDGTSSSRKVETTRPTFFTTATDNTPNITTKSSASRSAMADFFFLTLLMLLLSFVLL